MRNKRITSKLKKTCLALLVGAGLVAGAAGGADAIVNGSESAQGARPYQVSLQSGGEHYCGGSIIDATTIVTAAHCVEAETASGTTIRAGVTDVTSAAGQDVAVASITAHPSYAQNELADIAVIKLAEPLALGGDVQSIPLATADQVASAASGTVSGWGAVSEQGDGSSALLEADVPLVSDEACSVALGADAATEVCAGGTGTDSCYGDSGGPLVVNSANGLVLAGVVSWGEECGGATPGVYADVPGLAGWVNSISNGTATADAGDTAGDPDLGVVFDEDFGDEGYWDDDFYGEDFGDEDFWDEGYWDDDFYGEDFGDEGFGDEGFGDEGYWDDDFYGEDFGDEDFWDEGYWDDDFYGEDFGDEGFGDEGFGDEGYWDDDFYGEDFWDEDFWDEGYWDDDFHTDDQDSWDW